MNRVVAESVQRGHILISTDSVVYATKRDRVGHVFLHTITEAGVREVQSYLPGDLVPVRRAA